MANETDASNNVNCNGQVLVYPKVISCECRSVKLAGEIQGVVLMANGDAVENAGMEDADGNLLGSTDSFGRFILSVDSISGAKSIIFRPNIGSPFFPQLHVLRYSLEDPTLLTVILKDKPDMVASFNSTNGQLITIDNLSGSSVVTLDIPANAIFDSNGALYSDTVNVHATITDLSDIRNLENEIGVFETLSDEGEMESLETFGVIPVFATDTSGSILNIQQPITLTINTTALNIPVDANIYTLNRNTGGWDFVSTLTGDSRRKKRQADGQVTIPNVIVRPPIPYINCDRPFIRDRVCYVTVFVYADTSLTTPLNGIVVKAFIPTEGSPGSFSGITSAVTDGNGRACLLVACGVPNHVIRAYFIGGQLLEPTSAHNLPGQYPYTNQQFIDGNKTINQVLFTPGLKSDLDMVDPLTGPVYPRSHPYGATCYDATVDSYHFQFVAPPLPTGSLYPVEPRPDKELSWYPLPENNANRTAAFIAVLIQVSIIG